MRVAANRTYQEWIPLQPSSWATWLALGVLLAFSLFGPAAHGSRTQSVAFGLLSGAYIFVMFRALDRQWQRHAWQGPLRMLVTLSVLAIAEILFRPLGAILDPFYFLPVVSIGLSNGRRSALGVATAAALVILARNVLYPAEARLDGVNLLVLMSALYLCALTVTELRGQMLRRFEDQRLEIERVRRQAETRAEQLAVLHRLGRNVSRSLDVTSVCRAVHDSVTALMDCDAFFIVRFNAESEQREVVYLVEDGRRAPAMVLPMDDDVSSQVIRTREELGLDPSRASAGTPRPGWGCSPRARSLLCVPMILGERVVGAVAVQSEQPSAYDQGDVELLRLLAASAAAALENARRYEEVRDAATRLTVLNRVAQIVTSTLEGERVMELIYEQVSRVIPADSYFLATADLERDELYFEFMIDAGKRFAPEREPLGAGLSAWVLQNRAPLLLSNIPEQAAALGVEAKVWGEARPSLSWAGVPLLNGSTLLGLVAVASYEPDRFSQADVSLLQSIAQQAAIALDNARHHAEVQEQARLDSLTRVYNHGYFLKRLAEEVDRAQAERRPLSLIMLDIDRFKQYNDTYGHRAGDTVLTTTVAAIRTHIKGTDIVGRWGGEEFGIALPNATSAQAEEIAGRIKRALRQTCIESGDGRQIAAPTVSQGLATVPDHARDVDLLIQLADRALYRAKNAGRDQVSVAEKGK